MARFFLAGRARFVLYGWMLATVAKRQPDDIDLRVGRNLQRLRMEKGVSLFDLADALDVSVPQIQKYEAGRNRVSAARLYRSAQALGVTLDELFAGCGEPLPAGNGLRHASSAHTSEERLVVAALRGIEEPAMRKMALSFITSLAAKY